MTMQLAVGESGSGLATLMRRSGVRPACWSDTGWMVDLFFSDDVADIEVAKGICRTCDFLEPCLAEATAREEFSGVWGGQLFRHGRILAIKRNRGRPRRDLASLASRHQPAAVSA
ncbi:MAG TPA: WhiB family transcriptional regulator [Acidimicrobiales bacterium]|nr:WhiB family transcriptional regulator [Acidimicrobiales bacterium]